MGSVMVGVIVALVVGLTVGRIHEKARRARNDYVKMKALVTGMRKAAWTTTFEAIRAAFFVGIGLLVVFAMMFHIGASPD
jgi:hypothetical protein